MNFARRAAGCNRPAGAALAGLACLATLGCAAPLGQGWADFKTHREVEAAAADDSFPSAAEVGLASTQTQGRSAP